MGNTLKKSRKSVEDVKASKEIVGKDVLKVKLTSEVKDTPGTMDHAEGKVILAIKNISEDKNAPSIKCARYINDDLASSLELSDQNLEEVKGSESKPPTNTKKRVKILTNIFKKSKKEEINQKINFKNEDLKLAEEVIDLKKINNDKVNDIPDVKDMLKPKITMEVIADLEVTEIPKVEDISVLKDVPDVKGTAQVKHPPNVKDNMNVMYPEVKDTVDTKNTKDLKGASEVKNVGKIRTSANKSASNLKKPNIILTRSPSGALYVIKRPTTKPPPPPPAPKTKAIKQEQSTSNVPKDRERRNKSVRFGDDSVYLIQRRSLPTIPEYQHSEQTTSHENSVSSGNIRQ